MALECVSSRSERWIAPIETPFIPSTSILSTLSTRPDLPAHKRKIRECEANQRSGYESGDLWPHEQEALAQGEGAWNGTVELFHCQWAEASYGWHKQGGGGVAEELEVEVADAVALLEVDAEAMLGRALRAAAAGRAPLVRPARSVLPFVIARGNMANSVPARTVAS